MKTNMVGIFSLFLHIFLVVSFICGPNSAVSAIKTCKADNNKETFSISGWDWEVRSGTSESYFINICGQAKKCGKDTSVCKKGDKPDSVAKNYGASVTGNLPTSAYGKGFSITFNGTESSKPGCENKNIQTKINFQCDKILKYLVSYITKLIRRRDLSPLIKLLGGHRVSSGNYGVEIFINVCRDITFGTQVPVHTCSNDPKNVQTSPACRKDIKKPIGKITTTSKLYYDGDKIKLVYAAGKTLECPKGVTTDITFLCKEQFSNGGAGPVLVTNVTASKPSCHYDIIWGTGHACANNDVITKKCKFTNGEVSFDLTKLEKPKKELSYGLTDGDYEYRIKVCSNGQPCGSDVDGAHTAVCQIKTSTSQAYSCGSADDRSVRYADGDLTMVYKGGSPCKHNIHRRTIITFRCDPAVDVGKPTFVEEQHCYYYFEWKTRHVCPSRKPGECSVSESGETYDLSILTKNTNITWLAVNDRKEASGYTYYINVCGSLASMKKYQECRESAACEVKDGKGRGIGMYKTTPTISKSGSLSLVYTGGQCTGFGKSIKTIIKFTCKNKDLQSPPELESKSWDGCDYVFAWATAAACSLQVTTGKDCFLEDSVTGNVYDLSPLAKGTGGKDYFTVTTNSSDEYYIKICSKEGLDKTICGNRDSAGICQKTKDNKFHVAGNVHGNLYYYDGVLKLPFTKGDKCNRNKKPERQSYVTFFCNEFAGPGKPVFMDETEYCLYNFVWYTKYACPMKTMVCVVKDSQGNEYDLSPLVKTDGNWDVTKDGITYYINICRVLHQTEETSGCPSNSSACMKKAKGTAVSIGEISGTLTADKQGVVLQYHTNTIRTMITFICNHQGQTGELELDTHDQDKGLYSFTWTTKEACRIEPKNDESGCHDKHTRIYLLKTQDKKGYNITGPGGGNIILDICQNITCDKDTTSTVCFIKKGVAVSIGRSAKSTLEHSLDVTTLTYPGGAWKSTDSWGRYYKTRINFVCAPNVTKGKPEFIEKVENVYIIEFKTSVVCKSVDVECVATIKDKHYDLNPLTLTNGNWMAEDTRSHLDYYINVCRGYFPGNVKYQCKGSAGIGGCQVDNQHHLAHNMGYVMSGPVVSSAGHVTLRYLGGEKCHSKYDRSTRINFFCSDVHGSPVFMAETEDCEYVFNWKTPSACAVEKYNGKNCVVYDENYGFYFDLSTLNHVYSHDIEENIKYEVRFCGKTPISCGKDFDSCLVKGKSATKLLKFESMKYYDGKVIFTHKSSTFTIVNEISCDPKVETISPGGKTKTNAGYNILWTSKLVCPPVTGEECSITHERDLYDLSVLAKEKWNWLARNNIMEFGFQDYQFHFSVCKPLKNISQLANIGSRGAMENKKKGTFTSLGTMIAPLKIFNGYLTMTYGHGDEIQGGCKNRTTTIQFVCDDVVPEGVGVAPVVDGFDETTCKFHVTWLTRAACPVRSLLGGSNVPCTAIHPATKKTIDLRPLNNSKDGFYLVKDQDNNQYRINVCGSAKGCPKNSGICKIGKHNVNVGSVNTTLVYRQGFLYLHYKNGENCEGQQNRKTETLISFMCDPKAGNGKPTLERTNDCTHFVTWKTTLACEAEVDCVAHDGREFYDLTPLIKNDANYEVFYGTPYLINVCRSLVSGSGCPANAAVCRPTDGESFGHVSSPPKIVSGITEVKAQLIYKNGKCEGLGNTTINFFCDPKDLANKQMIVSADKCSVTISWWTSLVCPKKLTNNNCIFSDPEQKFCFDLKKLGGKHSVTFPDGNVHFHVCSDHIDDCKGAKHGEACLTIGDKLPKALPRSNINYNGQEVRISYGDEIVLILYCGEDGNSNTPQYIGKLKVNKLTTKYFFNMVTPEVCPPRKLPCEVKYNGKTFNLAGLSERSYRVTGKDNDYLVSICGHIQYTPETKICSSRATAVKISSKGKPQVIGADKDYTLKYQKEDTDYPIHLQYSSSEAICGKKKAKVLHKFKCKHGTMSPPQFSSFDDCVYTFLWQTAEACAEQWTPMKQNGDDWTFYDEKRSDCELDLIPLKNKLLNKYAKDCQLGTNVEVYSYDDKYELTVNCTVTSTHKIRRIDVTLSCGNDSEPTGLNTKSSSYISLLWETTSVCDSPRTTSCSNTFSRSVAKSAVAVIGTLTGIGLLAAILFFACKPEKRETAALWLRWHVRKYICCKPSYQASYRYKKVNTNEEDGETDFIIEAGAGSLFSDDSDDDDTHSSDDKDDDDLLPLDDDLLNLDE